MATAAVGSGPIHVPVDKSAKISDKEKALEFKNKGNAAFQQGDFQSAIYYFSKGIEHDPHNPTNYIFYSNRSAAYFALPDYRAALQDAENVIKLKPDWPKGYSRKGAALVGCKQLALAVEAYREGLKYDPVNTLLLEGLEVAQSALQGGHGSSPGDRHQGTSPPASAIIQTAPAPQSPPSLARPSASPKFSPSSPAGASPSNRSPTAVDVLLSIAQFPVREQAEWHVELYKDRIWLSSDDTMFRPQTAYLFDLNNSNPVYLGLAAHLDNNPWEVTEIVNLLAESCMKYQLRPKSVNLPDSNLQHLGQPAFKRMAITCTKNRLSTPLKTAIMDYIKEEERGQEEGMAADPSQRFSSVIWKRRQIGMLKVDGAHPPMIQGLLKQAAAYYRSKVFDHFQKHVKLQILPGNTVSIASVVGTGGQSHGLAYFESLEQMEQPPSNYYAVTYLFADVTSIPFDDVDDIATYGWEIADENAYPLPLVYLPDKSTLRPTAQQLQWFEIAFGALHQFVEATLMKPNFALSPSGTSRTLQVDTHNGPVSVVVTLPGTLDSSSPLRSKTAAASSSPADSPPVVPPIPPPPASLLAPDGSFYPSQVFQGSRPGFAFTRGPSGVGYYLDPMQKAAEPQRPASKPAAVQAAQAAQAAFQKAQSQGQLPPQGSVPLQSQPPAQQPQTPANQYVQPPSTTTPMMLSPGTPGVQDIARLNQDLQHAMQVLAQEREANNAAQEEMKKQMRLIQQQLQLLAKQNEQLVKKLQDAPQATQAQLQQQQQNLRQQQQQLQLQHQQMIHQQPPLQQRSQYPSAPQGAPANTQQPPQRPATQQISLQQQQQPRAPSPRPPGLQSHAPPPYSGGAHPPSYSQNPPAAKPAGALTPNGGPASSGGHYPSQQTFWGSQQGKGVAAQDATLTSGVYPNAGRGAPPASPGGFLTPAASTLGQRNQKSPLPDPYRRGAS